MSEGAQGTEASVVEVRLRDGGTLKARSDGPAADLVAIQRALRESEFVQIGDDTIVRSAEVQSIQIKSQASGGLLDSLKSRVPGSGDDAEDRPRRREEADSGRGFRELGRQRLIETKPFLFTSEFILAFAAWLALLLTTLATDSVDAFTFWLLSVAIAAGYMLSRGFAKANAASESWDPRDDLVSPGR